MHLLAPDFTWLILARPCRDLMESRRRHSRLILPLTSYRPSSRAPTGSGALRSATRAGTKYNTLAMPSPQSSPKGEEDAKRQVMVLRWLNAQNIGDPKQNRL